MPLLRTQKLEIQQLLTYFFPNYTILSFFFLFSFIIDLYFLIPAVTAQILNSTAKRVMPIETETNESNAESEPKVVNVKAEIANI